MVRDSFPGAHLAMELVGLHVSVLAGRTVILVVGLVQVLAVWLVVAAEVQVLVGLFRFSSMFVLLTGLLEMVCDTLRAIND